MRGIFRVAPRVRLETASAACTRAVIYTTYATAALAVGLAFALRAGVDRRGLSLPSAAPLCNASAAPAVPPPSADGSPVAESCAAPFLARGNGSVFWTVVGGLSVLDGRLQFSLDTVAPRAPGTELFLYDASLEGLGGSGVWQLISSLSNNTLVVTCAGVNVGGWRRRGASPPAPPQCSAAPLFDSTWSSYGQGGAGGFDTYRLRIALHTTTLLLLGGANATATLSLQAAAFRVGDVVVRTVLLFVMAGIVTAWFCTMRGMRGRWLPAQRWAGAILIATVLLLLNPVYVVAQLLPASCALAGRWKLTTASCTVPWELFLASAVSATCGWAAILTFFWLQADGMKVPGAEVAGLAVASVRGYATFSSTAEAVRPSARSPQSKGEQSERRAAARAVILALASGNTGGGGGDVCGGSGSRRGGGDNSDESAPLPSCVLLDGGIAVPSAVVLAALGAGSASESLDSAAQAARHVAPIYSRAAAQPKSHCSCCRACRGCACAECLCGRVVVTDARSPLAGVRAWPHPADSGWCLFYAPKAAFAAASSLTGVALAVIANPDGWGAASADGSPLTSADAASRLLLAALAAGGLYVALLIAWLAALLWAAATTALQLAALPYAATRHNQLSFRLFIWAQGVVVLFAVFQNLLPVGRFLAARASAPAGAPGGGSVVVGAAAQIVAEIRVLAEAAVPLGELLLVAVVVSFAAHAVLPPDLAATPAASAASLSPPSPPSSPSPRGGGDTFAASAAAPLREPRLARRLRGALGLGGLGGGRHRDPPFSLATATLLFDLCVAAYWDAPAAVQPAATASAVPGVRLPAAPHGLAFFAAVAAAATDTVAFVLLGTGARVFVVFRGTATRRAVELDFDYVHAAAGATDCLTGGAGGSHAAARLHKGFATGYLSVRVELRAAVAAALDAVADKDASPPRLFLTGHSLGGALASIAAVDLESLVAARRAVAWPRSGGGAAQLPPCAAGSDASVLRAACARLLAIQQGTSGGGDDSPLTIVEADVDDGGSGSGVSAFAERPPRSTASSGRRGARRLAPRLLQPLLSPEGGGSLNAAQLGDGDEAAAAAAPAPPPPLVTLLADAAPLDGVLDPLDCVGVAPGADFGAELDDADAVALYTFGAPRVGNRAWAALSDARAPAAFRLVLDGDAVASLPPILAPTARCDALVSYKHGGTAAQLSVAGDVLVEPSLVERTWRPRAAISLAAHRLAGYRRALLRARAVAGLPSFRAAAAAALARTLSRAGVEAEADGQPQARASRAGV